MTYSFRVGVLELPLFDSKIWTSPKPGRGNGRVQARERRKRFRDESREVIEVTIDDDAATALVDMLGLDSDGLAVDLERYTQVGYRAKARGLGGGRLGDAGEMLACLAHREASGRTLHERLTRVVECRNLATSFTAPMPDFLLADGRALEIKTREFVDFQDLAAVMGASGANVLFAGCEGLSDARSEGLLQLGYDDGVTLTRETHTLRTSSAIVPFPSRAGVLDIVFVRDVRFQRLQGQKDVPVTHRECTAASRDCWTCCTSGEPLDALLVELHNAPDALPIRDFEERESWHRAYGTWSRALWSRLDSAKDLAEPPLSALIEGWVSSMAEARGAWVAEFWSQYLATTAWERGLSVDLAGDDAGREPTAARARLEDLPDEIAARLADSDTDTERLLVSGGGREYTVMIERDAIRVRGLFGASTPGGVSEDDARKAINQMLQAAFGAAPEDPSPAVVQVAAVRVVIADRPDTIAFRPSRALEGGWDRNAFWDPNRPWLTWLRMGDPRASLFAFADGRIELTIRRQR